MIQRLQRLQRRRPAHPVWAPAWFRLPPLGLLLTILAGLVPLLWVTPGFIAKAEDFVLPIDMREWLSYFSTWNTQVGFGASPDDRLPAVFFMFWPAFFRLLGFPIDLAQRFQFSLWFMAGGLGMYFLMSRLTRSEIARLGAVLLYLFNFYQEPVWQGVNIANLSAYVVLPILLGIVISVAKGGRIGVYAAWFALASIIGSGIAVNPPMVVIALLPVPLYIALFIGARLVGGDRGAVWRMLRFAGLALALTAVVNAYWLVPQSFGLITSGPSQVFLGRTQDAAQVQLQSLSSFTPPLNVLRLQGHWVWYDTFQDVPYIPHAPVYLSSPEAIVASVIPIAAALIGLLAVRDRRFFAFAVIMVLGLFLGSGTNGPTGPLFGWMWNHVPGFWVLRSPWYKATALTLLGAAPLAGLALAAGAHGGRSLVGRWLPRIRWTAGRQAAVGALFSVALVSPYLAFTAPVITGQFFIERGPDSPLPGFQVQIPAYLQEANEWLREQPGDFRILALPPALRLTTDWGYTGYVPPLGELSSRPFINLVEPSDMPVAVFQSLIGSSPGSPIVFLARSGIRYVMQQDDVNRRYFVSENDPSPEETAELLGRLGFQEERRFGPLHFYRVPGAAQLVTATRVVITAPVGLSLLFPLTELVGEEDAVVVLTPRVPAETVWRLLGSAGQNDLTVIPIDGVTDVFLDRIFERQPTVLSRGQQSARIGVNRSGVYEIWENRRPADSSVQSVHGRLLEMASQRRRSGIDWARATVADVPLSPPAADATASPTRDWDLVGTFRADVGARKLSLADPVSKVDRVELVVANRDDRLREERDVLALIAHARLPADWRLLVDIEAEDVTGSSGAGPAVELWHGWAVQTPSESAAGVRRLTTAQKFLRNLKLARASSGPRTVALAFTARSLERSRSLWVLIGGQFVAVYSLPANKPQEIVLDALALPPGDSYVGFYSPDPETFNEDGEFVSFEFKLPIAVGLLSPTHRFSVRKAGAYEIGLFLGLEPDETGSTRHSIRSLTVDGVELVDRLQPSRDSATARVSVLLTSGEHVMRIEQYDGTSVPVLVSPAPTDHQVDAQSVEVSYQRLRNTHVRATVESNGPYVLVLNELFDPRWAATVDGRPVEDHFEVNGFANGFLIRASGRHVVEMEFSTQRLADRSLIVSATAIAILLFMLVLALVWRRRRT